MVIKNIAEMWKQEKKQYVKVSTMSTYLLLINNHINPYFGEKEEFVEHDVQDYVLLSLKKGLSEKSIKDSVVVIKMIQRYAVKNGLMVHHPIDIGYPSSTEKNVLEVMSKLNQKKLMMYAITNFSFKNLGFIICLSSGLRIGELCALKWEDIDIDNSLIKIRHTVQRVYHIDVDKPYTEIMVGTPKTKESNRDIPFSGQLKRMLKPLIRIVNPSFFVLSNSEKPIEPRVYRNYYKHVLNKLDIPYLKFQGLRHSFATRCIESKNDVKTVSVILGHSNITTTLNLYVHPNNEEKRKCIEKMLKTIDIS